MEFVLAPEIFGKVKIAALMMSGLHNSAHSPELWQEIDDYCQQARNKYGTPADAASLFEPSRKLYHDIGLDPTKNRPSSEALLRRVIQNKPLYRVNTLVDAANFFSLCFQLSVGFYDLSDIQSPMTCRIGLPGEGYPGINKGWINVSGKLTLVDKRSPFGNPSSDSDRTKITLSTSEALLVVFAPADMDEMKLQESANEAGKIITAFAKGKFAGIL
jgi:DNA/RNA-binding domain of Phe-tRNA-synthetase-like protein